MTNAAHGADPFGSIVEGQLLSEWSAIGPRQAAFAICFTRETFLFAAHGLIADVGKPTIRTVLVPRWVTIALLDRRLGRHGRR